MISSMQTDLLIRESFSQASKRYDKLSFIQQQIADRLLGTIPAFSAPACVLDIGTGTGYVVRKLQPKSPHVKVFGLDSAFGMAEKAKQKNAQACLIQADAKHLPFRAGSFDAAISNLTYQWVANLEFACREVKRVLKPGSKFYFTIFLDGTLCELREAIFEISQKEPQPIGNLPNEALVRHSVCKAEFRIACLRRDSYCCRFQGLLSLLRWLKLIGANRYWSGSFYEGLAARSFVDALAKKYEARYQHDGKVFATFDVLFVEAQRR